MTSPKEPENSPPERFAEPTAFGLLGLAIACAALTPIAFGASLSPAGLRTAAIFCLLFGGGCQFLSGMMNFANRNLYGGTLLTTFSFNWVINWWVLDGLANNQAPDHTILLATDTLFLIIFVVFSYGFGFFSKLFFAFLIDIDLLYLCKVINGATATRTLELPIAILVVGLIFFSLWIAFALLINKTVGHPVFPIPGPLFRVKNLPAPETPAARAPAPGR